MRAEDESEKRSASFAASAALSSGTVPLSAEGSSESDMPLRVQASKTWGQLGFVTHLENIGRYMNHGVDIRLAANIVRKQDYGISAYVNFSYNRDKGREIGRASCRERV